MRGRSARDPDLDPPYASPAIACSSRWACERETLRRLRRDPRAALCLLAEGLAFTAHGEVRIVGELESAETVVAVELSVARVQDHLLDGRTQMLDGARWRWLDGGAAAVEPSIVAELERLGGEG